MPLLGDAVTARGIGLEGHGRDLWSGGHSLPMASRPRRQRTFVQQGGNTGLIAQPNWPRRRTHCANATRSEV
jgi:hypothetical protein